MLGGDFFFDAAESFASDLDEFNIWLQEPASVKERRRMLLSRMGFERVLECGDAVSSPVRDSLSIACRDSSDGEANCSYEESVLEWSVSVADSADLEHFYVDDDVGGRKTKGWLNAFVQRLKKRRNTDSSKAASCVEVGRKEKKFMEFTGVYGGQEISGHKGSISTMKFSPDGMYIASAGEDGVVRVWSVSSGQPACNIVASESSFRKKKKKTMKAPVIVPEKVLHINESPLHEFHGHTSQVLDIAWSSSNQILSASMDNTVRLWQVGSSECLSVFLHTNYVTCVQFNPVDENNFISGSIDGKIRIWGVEENRVVDWANTRDIVSAVCYQPNGEGFVSGFLSGICRFYQLQGTEPFLQDQMYISGKRKSRGSRITGIKFLGNESHRIMITSEDSKIRILDGFDVVHKYQAPSKSGSQTSASFTCNGQHIVSVGDDSRIYVWNYDNQHIQSAKSKKSARSCEYFSSQCASIAIPWSGIGAHTQVDSAYQLLQRGEDRFSLASWFSMDALSKGAVTWPEEKLPQWEVPYPPQNNAHHIPRLLEQGNAYKNSATWGTAIITAGWDGKIRTFHNFGLPIKM